MQVQCLQEEKKTGFDTYSKIIFKNRDHGGITAIAYGIMGSGKTTLLLRLAEKMVDQGEKVIWRGMTSCQWFYSPIPVNLILPRNFNAILTLIDEKRDRKIDEYDARDAVGQLVERVSFYTSIEDVYRKVRKNYLNTVYFLDKYDWLPFFEFLNRRKDVNWISIFLDEVHNIFPSHTSGEDWHRCKDAADYIAEFRKNFISLYIASHDYRDVDHRILFRINFWIYLKGAEPPRWSKVKNFIKTRGRGIVEERGGDWQHFKFQEIKRQPYVLKIDFEVPLPPSPE